MGIDLQEKYLGAMVGSALGDAIGELAFRYPHRRRLLSVVDQLETLVYTDDTAMAIGLAESIVETKTVDQKHLGDTFSRNYRREPWRGYAMGPPTIFSMVLSSDMSYVEAAESLFGGSGSLGNGAAMRIAPLGLFFHRSDRLYDEACASAGVTHAHPVGKDGAAVQAKAVAHAVKIAPRAVFSAVAFAEALIGFARTPQISEKMSLVERFIRQDVPPSHAADPLGRSVAVHESMPFAIYAFLRYPKSFEECLFCAVLNGGDRDTLGAMACAVSGAYLGYEAIPWSWRKKLENRETIEGLASALAEF